MIQQLNNYVTLQGESKTFGPFSKDTVFGTTQCEHMATQNNFTPVHQREVSLAGTLGWCDPRYDFSTRGALEHFQKK